MTATAYPTITLSSGRTIPALAFGTGTKWFKRGASANTAELNRELVDVIKTALASGLRHIDTAEVYNTEGEVGVALEEYLAENPAVKREDLYITSKVFPGLGDLRGTLEKGLKLARTAYFDLYLIHAPFLEKVQNLHGKTLAQLWEELEQAQADGLVRDIGVSNFDAHHIDALSSGRPTAAMPVLNQIEFHPLLPQPNLRADHARRGIRFASYGPLVPIVPSGPLGDKVDGTPEGQALLQVVDKIAARLTAALQGQRVSRGSVLWRWNLDQGHVVVSTSAKPERIREFVRVGTLPALTAEERSDLEVAAAKVGKVRRFWAADLFQE